MATKSALSSTVSNTIDTGITSLIGVSTPINPLFWMQPESDNLDALSVGDVEATINGDAPTYVAGPAYHAGTVTALNFPNDTTGTRLVYSDLSGFPFTEMRAGNTFWVAWLSRTKATPPTNRIPVGNGGNTAANVGWRLLMNAVSGTVALSLCDGSVKKDLTFVMTQPQDIWVVSVLQIQYTTTGCNTRFTHRGYRFSTNDEQTATGMTISSPLTITLPTVVGDNRATKSLPYVGDLAVAIGESSGWLDEAALYDMWNYDQFRLWSDMQKTNNTFIKMPFAEPRDDGGFNFSIRTTKTITIKAYDSSRNLLDSVGPLTPSLGFAKGSISGLDADEDLRVEFVDSSDNIAKREMRITTLPATDDYTFMQTGCSKWADEPTLSGQHIATNLIVNNYADLSLSKRPYFCFWMEDFGYMDPTAATTANYLARFDTVFTGRNAWMFYDHMPFFASLGDHHYENDADSTSIYISAGVTFGRRMLPHPDNSYGHASEGAYYTLVLNDIQFVLMDTRTGKVVEEIDGSHRLTKNGVDGRVTDGQHDWFEDTITAAEVAGRVSFVGWSDELYAGGPNTEAWHADVLDTSWDDEIEALFNHLKTTYGTTNPAGMSFSGNTHNAGLDDGTTANVGNWDTGQQLEWPVSHCTRFLHGFPQANSTAYGVAQASAQGLWALHTLSTGVGTIDVSSSLYAGITQTGASLVATLTLPT